MLPEIYTGKYYDAQLLNKIIIDGHEAGYYKVSAKSDYIEYLLACDCSISDDKEFEFNPWVSGKCKYRHAAMALRQYEVAQELRGKYDLDDFELKFPYISDAFKNAVFELFERSQNNEWLGGMTNYLSGKLVSDILKNAMEFGADMETIWTCVHMLEREEKLASGTGPSYAGILVPYDKRRKRKNPEYPYTKKEVSSFVIKVFSPLSGFDPMEWLIQVFNSGGKNVYEIRIPIEYTPKWTALRGNKDENHHPIDIARMNLGLAETEYKIWENSIEWSKA